MKNNFKMFIRRFKYLNNPIIIRLLSTNRKSLKSAKLIRTEFLEYFAKNNHTIVRSSPVVPLNDPSIPFVNAGMNQFKGVLLGDHNPPAFRVANSQKCIRVGGKHNDLDVVGNDSYHHTFFEMLGNWSFGDYFKKEACKYAWELLTEIYGIKKDFLYTTYFGGNEKLNLKPDLECKEIWLEIGVPEDHILPFGIEDNFWEMGPTGPCGPCTEIHIDHTMQFKNQASRVNKGHNDLTELWNIVFVEYQRLRNGQIIPLLKKHIDTGMGFERLVTVLQEKRSNYDTDIFQPLFKTIEQFAHAPKYQGRFGIADKNKIDTGYRILSDHARMVTVALSDGMLPDKNHKLRRILRRAIDISEETFGTSKLLLELTNHVAYSLGDIYPEIHKNLSKVQHIILFEEEVMKIARNNAIKNWQKVVANRPELSVITDTTSPGLTDGYYELQTFLKSEYAGNSLPGDFVYRLYDTFGLNLETISKLAEIEAVPLDLQTFEEIVEKTKERSRCEADKLDEEIITEHSLNLLESRNVQKTDDLFKYDYTFTEKGYQFPVLKCKLVGMIMNGNLISEPELAFEIDESQIIVEATVTNSGNIVESSAVINTNTEIGIILDKTLAYSTAGSQISDKGYIQIKNLLFNFEKVKKIRDYVIHIGHFADWDEANPEHELQIGDDCLISIDEKTRLSAMKNHTATHLLNASLQRIVPVTGQRGSDVFKDSLNFECSVFGKRFTCKEVLQVEKFVNEAIAANVPVTTKTVNILQMLNEDNLTVIPGEVYPDTGIRIVQINSPNLKSKEACCGTHVHKTGVLEDFCITSLKVHGNVSISIKAVTGPVASLARLAGNNLKDRIINIENDLKLGTATLKELKFRIKNEKNELLDKKKRIRFPYIVAQECLEKLEALSKNIKLRDRELRKNTMEEEIRKMLISSSLPFVVHCLQPTNTSLENITLRNVIKLCPSSTPVLVIVHCKERVKARCFVPEQLQTQVFNAKTWMEEISHLFQSKGMCTKGDNPCTSYNMQPVELSNENFKALIGKAITAASKFASANINRNKKNTPNE